MKKILLLTNGDYDNVGDQMIEACDVALIRAALKNLGARENEVSLQSRGVSLVPNEYVATHDPTYLREAERPSLTTGTRAFTRRQPPGWIWRQRIRCR